MFFDGNGLLVAVSARTGRKVFKLAYRLHGSNLKKFTLGAYPELSLAQAREKALELKRQIASGIDPAQAKKEQKQASLSFSAVAAEFLEKKKNELAASTYAKRIKQLKHFHAAFGECPMQEIEPAAILEVLRQKEREGKGCTAHELAQLANQIFAYAKICQYIPSNPASDLSQALSRYESRNQAAILEPAEVGRALNVIDGYRGHISTLYALKLMPLVVLRSTELRLACWQEVDLDKAVWTIPASHMKTHREFVVPLSRQAVVLIHELKTTGQPGSLLFPGLRSPERPISDNTLLSAYRYMGFAKDELSAHGWRSTFSTIANQQKLNWKIDSDIIEAALSHKSGDKIRDIYNRTDYFDERRRLMQLWADYLDELKAGQPGREIARQESQ